MTLDYASLGLKVGLEIHRQIESHKLFCHCPSELRDREPDFTILRDLRAVVSERQEHDTVALFEKGKGRRALYEGFYDVCCLVELDDEPIHRINTDALRAVVQVCKMTHLNMVDLVHVMRKQVLDYSNTSGFQRTALLGYNGFLETPQGMVGVQTICIEEDSARKSKETETHVVYRLDRLGIPLIEIATAPDMHDPLHVQEVAQHIGMMLRSAGTFKSGIGTIRQDVNISIHGHPRVELKGVQDLRMIPLIVELEVKRQMKNVQKGVAVSEVRNVKQDGTSDFLRPMPGAARMYVETDHPPFSIDTLYHSVEIPQLLTERLQIITQRYNIHDSLARSLVDEGKLALFERLIQEYRLDPNVLAYTLIEVPKEIHARYAKEGADVTRLRDEDYEMVMKQYHRGAVGRDAIFQILLAHTKGHMPDMKSYKSVSDDVLEQEIRSLVHQEKGASANAIMGAVMKKYKGRIDGKKAMLLIRKVLGSKT